MGFDRGMVRCGSGVGPWRHRAAQRSTIGRQQAQSPAADHLIVPIPVHGKGSVVWVKQRPASGVADAGMVVGWLAVVCRLCARFTGRLNVGCMALQSDCSAVQVDIQRAAAGQGDARGLARAAGRRGWVWRRQTWVARWLRTHLLRCCLSAFCFFCKMNCWRGAGSRAFI